jgi:four helix bundle protein
MTLYYQNLEVWKKAFLLAQKIHLLLKNFPKEEQYALTDQIRRSSISIASNIAEWSGRGWDAERIHFLHIAKGSAMELHTQILLAEKFGYISTLQLEEIIELNEEVIKMLYGMVSKK